MAGWLSGLWDVLLAFVAVFGWMDGGESLLIQSFCQHEPVVHLKFWQAGILFKPVPALDSEQKCSCKSVISDQIPC